MKLAESVSSTIMNTIQNIATIRQLYYVIITGQSSEKMSLHGFMTNTLTWSLVAYSNCHSPTQPQHELELDLIMGRNPPPTTTHPPTQELLRQFQAT